jgi:hypothetical protein
MRNSTSTSIIRAAICAAFIFPGLAHAHGIVGDRIFPPTITTDDPFAVDELALPTFSYFKNPASGDEPANREMDAGFEFDKEIFTHFAMGISDTHIWQKPKGERSIDGWDDLTLTAKYQFWQNARHEAILAVGLETDIGGTGRSNVSDSFSTFTPTMYFGKGFGDLPESLNAFRPFALTGTIGQTFPTKNEEANTLEWGFALEYSLPYLQQHVKDIGLPAPFKDMIPLVEFSFETGENRDDRGITTGTINPGILWETRHFQLGAEALIPVNHESGDHVGFVIQMWIFIDDLLPKTFGHPLFGD